MQDCESLLICHLCIHRYKSIDIDECAEAERSRDGGGVMEQCLKDHEYESSAESVHPTSSTLFRVRLMCLDPKR
jgi:hypothetical protein